MNLKYTMKRTTMDINEIKDYIIKKYPNSCLACNYNEYYYDEQLIKECEDFFYYEKLNWCGCGSPEIVKKTIRDFLRILYDNKKELLDNKMRNWDWNRRDENFQERFGVKSVYDNELLLCLAYTLDAAEFTEHGSGIGGAWIDIEGEMFLWLLNQNEDLDND